MVAALSTGAEVAEILGSMPSLADVGRDTLALDALAWSCTTWYQAIYTRHKQEFGRDDIRRAWLSSMSVARTIKEDFLSKFDPEVGPYWLDRWNEFRAIVSPHERFGLLTYLLFTSKSHAKPMKRYPGSPPLILDLSFGLETVPAELACGHTILAGVDAYIDLARRMPNDDPDDDIDDDEV